MPHRQRLSPMVTVMGAALLLGACQPANVASAPSAKPVQGGSIAAAKDGGEASQIHTDGKLLAAAEVFENLTETAFSDSPAGLELNIAKGEAAVQMVRSNLAAQAGTDIERQMIILKTAAGRGERASVAIAAVETFRILVSSVSSLQKVPVAVSLLDYAGFRYDADLQANGARWADASEAATFAEKQWDFLGLQVSDVRLRAKIDRAIADMQTRAMAHQVVEGRAAAKTELDLVDALEAYFTKSAT